MQVWHRRWPGPQYLDAIEVALVPMEYIPFACRFLKDPGTMRRNTMRRTALSIWAAGLLAGAVLPATVQDVVAAKQPNAKADSIPHKPARQTEFSMAAIDNSKEADYKAAKAKAQTEYKQATAKCRKRSTKAIPGCMADAKAVRAEALAQAKARWGKQQ